MAQSITPTRTKTTPDTALRLLEEAWSYYTPRPRLVTEQNSQPSPVFEEYYAA